MICAALPINAAGLVRSWIVDTGSSVDAIDKASLSKQGRKSVTFLDETTFQTAAGPALCNSSITLYSRKLGGDINAVVLDDTPPLFSMGRRCMEEGYGFYWPPGLTPFILKPNGQRIDCEVVGNVPYLIEENGVSCPLSKGNSSSSSSSRTPVRDEGITQPAKEELDKPKGLNPNGPADSVHETINEEVEEAEGHTHEDDMTLMQIEADSLYHLLTHTPKNPNCPACRRAKMQKKPHRRKAIPIEERAQAEKFGDLITGDHIVTIDKIDKSIDGKRDAVVIYDVATMFLECYPTGTKSADETIQALQHFIGPKGTVSLFYSDAARELHSAAKVLGICKDQSTPGRPQSNGLAESKVRKVLQGTRTILEHAGMDPSYWSYACKHFCFCHNHSKHYVREAERQEPILSRLIPDNFRLPDLYPFGCLVDFLPSPIFLRKYPKWGAKAQPGVLLSYVSKPGGVWKGEYIVALLADFQNHVERPQVHTIREVQVIKEDGKFVFPLKSSYEKARHEVLVPESKSDHHAEGPDEEEPADEETEDLDSFDVPPIEESGEQNDASNKQTHDSGPKPNGESTTNISQPANTSSPTDPSTLDVASTDKAKVKAKARKEPAGYSIAYGEITRNKANSERPPDIPGVIWRTLRRKEKDENIRLYKERGWAWKNPDEQGTIVPIPSGTTDDDISLTAIIHSVPSMPTVTACRKTLQHREKISSVDFPLNLCVARTVTKKEAAVTPEAQAAMNKEWDKLEKQKAWVVEDVREWVQVSAEAKAKGQVVHVGRVFGILVEKGSELPKGHPERKFKGRVVFQGNNVRDQAGDYALFEELSSAPATMEAGKAVDAYGAVEGNVCQQADGTSAYTQALLGGVPTWVRLPRDRWPKGWEKFRDPVCTLRLALYGHPDAGGYWEQHCDRHILSEGWNCAGLAQCILASRIGTDAYCLR